MHLTSPVKDEKSSAGCHDLDLIRTNFYVLREILCRSVDMRFPYTFYCSKLMIMVFLGAVNVVSILFLQHYFYSSGA